MRPAIEVLHRRPGAAIRHMRDVDADRPVEQHAGQVRSRADARRAELHPGLVCLGVGDELPQAAHRQILARDEDARRLGGEADRREIAGRVIKRLLVERLVIGVGAGVADEEGIAVRRRLRDAHAARHAGGGADVLDHDRLSQELAHVLRLDARAGVDAASGRERHDERDGPCRPGLRHCDARKAKTCRGTAGRDAAFILP